MDETHHPTPTVFFAYLRWLLVAYLAPMNFEALYLEQQQQEKAAAAKVSTEIVH